MTRSEQREEILILSFEKTFHQESIDEIIELAKSTREDKINDFIENEVKGIFENLEKIDSLIEDSLIGWKINRIARVNLCIMRICVYEMLFDETIPTGVAINEALELCNKYSLEEDKKFINGVLGTISRKI